MNTKTCLKLLQVCILTGLCLLSSCNDDILDKYRKYDRRNGKGKDGCREQCNTLVSPVTLDAHTTPEKDYHFEILDGEMKGYHLYISNFEAYSAKIEAGKFYKIGYSLEPVCTMDMMDSLMRFAKITCLSPVDDGNTGAGNGCGCTGRMVAYEPEFSLHASHALKGAYMKGDKLFLTGEYISTHKESIPDYHLLIDERPGDTSKYKYHIAAKLDIKHLQAQDPLVDLHTYNKDYCFDLAWLKEKYSMQMHPGKIVLNIEIELADGSFELVEFPVN